MPYYQYQLFFCTNLRQNEKKSCAAKDAVALRDYAKSQLKKLGLHEAGKCRANTCSCLGRCEEGPVLVIYPEGVWYSYKTYNDIDEIIQRHLLKGEIVARLCIPSSPEEKLAK